ncbi:MAG TPA: hypothetical protein VJP02_10340 [Candidatus Sulfotelmatobacter sp.]|nr:hypothetical protein [Candidatus Sulfotelmatobacter sp.]
MRLLTSLAVLLICSSLSFAQMTHEETVVRGAYAKLSFAMEQAPIFQLAFEATGALVPKEVASLSTAQRIANAQLTVSLSDFLVGNAKDILTRRVVDLINPAQQERLVIDEAWHSYHDGREFRWYEPKGSWQSVRESIPSDVEAMTLEDFFKLQWQQRNPTSLWQTYAWYSVTVTYQGRTVGPYKALFMFGHDSNGGEIVEPEDGTIDAVAIAASMREHLFADVFVSANLRDVPVVSKWVTAKQQALNCSDSQGVCCDLARLQCGPAQSLVQRELATPVKGRAQ